MANRAASGKTGGRRASRKSRRAARVEAEACEAVPDSSDRGFSLSEILVAISLMGTSVVVVLTSIQAVIFASQSDRNHAQTFEWLQAASDAVHLVDRVPCTDNGQGRLDAIAAYDAAAQSATVPAAWNDLDATIEVVDVEYLGRATSDAEFSWSPNFCFEGGVFTDSPLYTQRVTIEVWSPSDGARQTLQMVKSE